MQGAQRWFAQTLFPLIWQWSLRGLGLGRDGPPNLPIVLLRVVAF